MRTWTRTGLAMVAAGAVIALGANDAGGATIQELVRLKGHEENIATGLGIVIGLNGTGDSSKDSYVAARPYAALLESLGNHVPSLEELEKADSYAIVMVTLRVPPVGVSEGDRLEVSVDAMYNAESLAGGRLVFSPLRLPGPDLADSPVLAYAEGPLSIGEENPRSGVVRGGAQMLVDIRNHPLALDGTVTLVIDDQYAGYPVAAMIATVINDEFMLDGYHEIAVVEDGKHIRVHVPEPDRARPATFLSTLMLIPIDATLLQTPARIVINERSGTIIVTGHVEIGPVAITHRDMTITSITPPPPAAQGNATTRRWAGIDTTDRTGRSSTRLVELLQAFDQLNVPVEDQIDIIHELKRTGQLHAEIIHE